MAKEPDCHQDEELAEARSKIESLRAALQFYADETNWDNLSDPWEGDYSSRATEDEGEIARNALATLNQQQPTSKCVTEHMGGERCVGKCLCPKDCSETPLKP